MSETRLQKYIKAKKRLGQKRVSFFVDEKVSYLSDLQST